MRKIGFFALLLAMAVVSPRSIHAEDAFPARPIRLIVPLAPGGTTDIVARMIAEKSRPVLQQVIVTENRPGAGGTLGSDVVARSAPDGYTLLMGTIGTLAVSPAIYKTMPYDTDRAFEPIILATAGQFILVGRPDLPAQTLPEFLALARKEPGMLNYGSAGVGSTLHLGMELLKSMAGVQVEHVPYKSSGELVVSLMAGHVDVGMPDVPSALSQIKSGKIRPIALTGRKRAEALPDVATVREAGFDDFNIVSWLGILAPAGTPKAVVDKLNRAFVHALRDPETVERMKSIDTEVLASSPGEFAEFIRAERVKWAQVVKASGASQ